MWGWMKIMMIMIPCKVKSICLLYKSVDTAFLALQSSMQPCFIYDIPSSANNTEPIRLWENEKQLCIAPWSKHDTALFISTYNICEYLRSIIINVCALLKGLVYIKVDIIIIGATDCHMLNMVFVDRKYLTGRQHNFKHHVAISLLLKIICY